MSGCWGRLGFSFGAGPRVWDRSCGQMGCGEWIQPPLSWFPWPVSYGATLGRWGRVLSPWAWLISLISWHRGAEFWPAGSQTVLPGGRNPFHLWRHYHCPVPESKGGYRGLWGAKVGTADSGDFVSTLRPLQSLKHGQGLERGVPGKAGTSQACPLGGLVSQ